MTTLPLRSLFGFAICCIFMASSATIASETKAERKARLLAPTSDFSKPEPFEVLQGGSGTNTKTFGRNAFASPSAALSFEQRADFDLGNSIFERPWVTAPSATQASDGLGPLFNARSCQGCHIKDGRGHPPQPGDKNMVSMLFSLSDHAGKPDPIFGHQFQDQSLPGLASEGTVSVSYQPIVVAYPDGDEVELRKPIYQTESQLSDGVTLNPRIAPPMIGLGLIEAIPAEAIIAKADPEDADGDGISGKAHWLGGSDTPQLGRFGWKNTAPSVLVQTAKAFHNDIGLSTRLFPEPYGDCTAAQPLCRNAIHGDQHGQPEIPDNLLDLVTFYSQNLAVPARRDVDHPGVLAGKQSFYQIGCVACHTPKFATSSEADKTQRNQLIWPYSDFLLHDLGPGLADANPTGDVKGSEWRTQPLWGIGLTQTVNGHTFFLHDGRARSLEEAIVWHGGEAQKARDAFVALPSEMRENLIRFLESL